MRRTGARSDRAAGVRVPPPRTYPPILSTGQIRRQRRALWLGALAAVPLTTIVAVRGGDDPPDPTSQAIRHPILWEDRHGVLDDRPLADHLPDRWPERTVTVGGTGRVALDVVTHGPDVVEVRWSPPADAPGRRPPDAVCFTRDDEGRVEATERAC